MGEKCFIGLGSNESTADTLLAARAELQAAFPGIRFGRIRLTQPIDFSSPRTFFNTAAVCDSLFTAEQLKARFKEIERALGRRANDKLQGIVKIDIDLLSYGGRVLKPADWERPYVREAREELSFFL